jgi:hypothetical protein
MSAPGETTRDRIRPRLAQGLPAAMPARSGHGRSEIVRTVPAACDKLSVPFDDDGLTCIKIATLPCTKDARVLKGDAQ